MAKLFFGMNVSLDGYVDHTEFAPPPSLFEHFIDQTRGLAGSIYGRTLYELMSFWDADQEEPPHQAFAEAWRANPKWVVSSTLTEVGPNATLLGPDWLEEVRRLKAQLTGDIEVAGPKLSQALGAAGLIDEYWIYLHPVVLGSGTPYFAGPLPRLRLVESTEMEGSILRLVYVPDDARGADA